MGILREKNSKNTYDYVYKHCVGVARQNSTAIN